MKFLIILGSDTTENKIIILICDVIEQKLQAFLGGKIYGDGVKEWQHTIYCDTFDFYKTNQRVKFSTSEKLPSALREGRFETNRWVDSEQVGRSTEKEVYRLICESILITIYNLSKLKDFNYQAFHDDIINLFCREGWIYMRFFMTGETEAIVGNKIDFFSSNSIAENIKSYISTRDYGSGVSFWGHIIICCRPELYDAGFFKEIKKYTKKDREVELRLRIDYEKMLKANEKEVKILICESVLRGVDIVENELEVKGFDFNAFRNDLISTFKKEGWL